MNSLQILSILSLNKTEELKELITPKKYYCLTYSNNIYFIYTSSYIFENEEILVEFLINILHEDIFPLCECCEEYSSNKKWTKEEVKNHILTYKHYIFESITYKIEMKMVISTVLK